MSPDIPATSSHLSPLCNRHRNGCKALLRALAPAEWAICLHVVNGEA